MKKYNVFITDFVEPPFGIEEKILGKNVNINFIGKINDSEFLDSISEADALMVGHAKITSKSLIKMKKCKVIVRYGVGFDGIDIQVAGHSGIPVCNIPDFCTDEVAERTMTMMLALTKKINEYNSKVKEGVWDWKSVMPVFSLKNKNLGIIGLGRIGSAVALRAKSFGMNIYFYDPYKTKEYGKKFASEKIGNLGVLLNKSDIISVHAPLTDETNGMVNPEFISQIKKGAILINTARGKIIENLDVLEKALKEKLIDSIGLDVLPDEPPDYNHPLIKSWKNNEEWIRDRLVLSPHAAFYSEESFFKLRKRAAEIVRKALNGKKLENVVNKKYL